MLDKNVTQIAVKMFILLHKKFTLIYNFFLLVFLQVHRYQINLKTLI